MIYFCCISFHIMLQRFTLQFEESGDNFVMAPLLLHSNELLNHKQQDYMVLTKMVNTMIVRSIRCCSIILAGSVCIGSVCTLFLHH